MRLKKSSLLFWIIISFGIFLLILKIFSYPSDFQPNHHNKEEIALLESRLRKLEDDISSNQDTILEIKALIKSLSNSNDGANLLLQEIPKSKSHNRTIEKVYSMSVNPKLNLKKFLFPIFNASRAAIQQDDCIFAQSSPSSVDIQMKDVYDILPFDDPDGGNWKQGWNIDYDPKQWSPENKLKVFVVPHSHNDPGWIKTFESYFEDQTRHILDNMVTKLTENHRMKFIWAEISYFMMWWDRQTSEIKDNVRRLVESGQLEIVTGGWVMPDEASSHYYALINQLITGHEWLELNLGVKPNNGWSIDPFGMSPTMAYILKKAGFQNMLIQRTHYSIKKYFAKEKNLEFRWRQTWDPEDSTDILTHMMPFYSYDVPHTCGPDPKVCCQFDFRRLSGSGVTCPWRIAPQVIDNQNVYSRARLLLDQYRKKAQLFRTNVLLVPLGDDFRYDRAEEWDNQFNNYQMLFEHMNSSPDLNVVAQFGTLADYFGALKEESNQQAGSKNFAFPSFSGDFFSYADRGQHYWTGYFTTRPFYKRMDRTLIGYLRSAEILYALMLETNSQNGWNRYHQEIAYSLMENLDHARRNHALFQHHDGITGTSKNHVVVDYANKMLSAIRTSQHIIQQAANSLLSLEQIENSNDDESTVYFDLSKSFPEHNSLPVTRVLNVAIKRVATIYIFNPEAHMRSQIITIRVDTSYVEVRNELGLTVLCQVDPQFTNEGVPIAGEFEVHFLVRMQSISLVAYSVHAIDAFQINPKFTAYSSISYKHLTELNFPTVFDLKSIPVASTVHLKCGKLSGDFDANGFLTKMRSDEIELNVMIKFIHYNAGMGGAYLFLPRGEARELRIQDSPQLIMEGPLVSQLILLHHNLYHSVILKNSPGIDGQGFEIDNYFDVKKDRNIELGMRLHSSISNGDIFYTDLNGFQIMKRTRYDKLPLQGNFYPISGQIYIEDQNYRLSLLSSNPMGGTSLKDGQMEVILDRTLAQDDERGLGHGITDNLLSESKFILLLEKRIQSKESSTKESVPSGFASLTSLSSLSYLLEPSLILYQSRETTEYSKIWKIGGELPCDIKLVNLRSLLASYQPGAPSPPSSTLALTLHRQGFDCSFQSVGINCSTNNGKMQLRDLLPRYYDENVKQMSLSHLYEGVSMSKSYSLSLKPMELYSFKLFMSSSKKST